MGPPIDKIEVAEFETQAALKEWLKGKHPGLCTVANVKTGRIPRISKGSGGGGCRGFTRRKSRSVRERKWADRRSSKRTQLQLAR